MELLNETTNQSINIEFSLLKNIMKHQYPNIIDYIKPIIQTGLDVNSSIKSTSYLELKQPNLIGCTPLHLAFSENCIEAFRFFLQNGADSTIKNRNGFTVLHQVLENFYLSIPQLTRIPILRLESDFADLILKSHSDSENFTNPCTNYGLTHFHAACLCNDAKLVKSFIEQRISVNDSVSKDSLIFPGYSPLHFAVRAYGQETVKILINSGANVNSKDADGKTPMHILIEHKIKLLNSSEYQTTISSDKIENILEEYEEILNLFYQHNENHFDDISPFYIACIMKDSSTLESMLKSENVDVNFAISQNSPFWPGYTGLHFAALCNIDNLILLLKIGADIEIQNNDGITAFDICLRKYKAEDIKKIISSVKTWKNILLSDNETTLLELVNSLENAEKLKEYFESSPKRISAIVPTNSPIWPSFTILHVAVQLFITNHEEIIPICFDVGIDFTAKTIDNSTALHLAFQQENIQALNLLCEFYHKLPNLTNNNNLSHLHIALASRHQEKFFTNLLQNRADVNISYKGKAIGSFIKNGFTPLHIAVVVGDFQKVKELLLHNANRYAVDINGFTPIHWIFDSPHVDSCGSELLSMDDIQEFIVSGLSHLHVACFIKEYNYASHKYIGKIDYVKKLLETPGTNVNCVVHYDKDKSPKFLEKLEGLTPLSLAIQKKNWEIANLMVECGADILIKQPDGSTPLYDALNLADNMKEITSFVSILEKDEMIFRRVTEDIGLTKLHFACYINDIEGIEKLLRNGNHFNEKIHKDSPVWPSWTPLHVLVKYRAFSDKIVKLLKDLEVELDVTLQNTNGDTAIHLAYGNNRNWLNYLFELQNLNINPVNNESLSHFHIACFDMNFEAIDKFLKSEVVDVNQPIDPFCKSYLGGESPLHLVLNNVNYLIEDCGSFQIVELLLKNGAQVRVKDVNGETPLHKIDRFGNKINFDVFKGIMQAGSDIHAIDIRGVTALDILLVVGNFSPELLKLFIKHGAGFNAYNPIDEDGCMSLIFVDHGIQSEEKKKLFDMLEEYPHTIDKDEKGRTVIHSLVANNSPSLSSEQYADLIGQLLRISGCDIDDQDDKGRTALCLAAKDGKKSAIKGLLIAGIDVNITDNNGKSAIEYLDERYSARSSIAISYHIKRIELLDLYVSPENKSFAEYVFGKHNIDEGAMKNRIQTEIELAKSIKVISPSFSLYHFLFENTNVAVAFLKRNKNDIERFFQDFKDKRFVELGDLLKLQYRKALARLNLIEPASVALHIVSGCPLECVELIVKLLTNYELKYLIEASQINEF